MPPFSQATAQLTEESDFREIYGQYNRLIYSRLVGHGLDREEARDLVSKTFLQAYRGWGSFRKDSSVKTWLIAIADRVALNHFRDRGRLKNQGTAVSIDERRAHEAKLPLTETLEAAGSESKPLENLIAQEKVRILSSALAQLPPQMQQVAILRIRKELTYQEIAETLQVSLNTVRSQLHEARSRLRKALKAQYGTIEF